MGVAFGIALSLVIVTGAELFTGNNLVMTAALVGRRVGWRDAGRVWGLSYVGNFAGAAILAVLFCSSGLCSGAVAEFIESASKAKMSAGFWDLFVRGILCNMLVCLAVYCALRLKEECARLIMVFWCLFAFITCGFEHSIANMTLLTVGLISGGTGAGLTLGGLAANLVPVTLGNMVGGCLLGAIYAWMPGPARSEEQPAKA